MSSYSEAALDYLAAGWTGVMPVPVETKFPPPSGYTGTDGADTDEVTVRGWMSSNEPRSIALRMPVGMIGIDVDHYDKAKTLPDGTVTVVSKRGADTLAEYEAKWGELPATWRSTGRGVDNPSGIRFFQVPAGLKLATVLGDAIEIIQRHHRYAVVAPSAHSTGAIYEWFHPEYPTPLDEFPVPPLHEMPELPATWVAGLSEHVNQSRTAPAASGTAQTLLRAIEADARPMCSMMEIATNRAVAAIHASSTGTRHDTAMARTMRIVGLAGEGHTGGAAALQRAREAWDVVTAGEHRDYEFDSLVHGAGAQAAGSLIERFGTGEMRALDPCDGAAGAGIEVVVDPGEGNRAVTLIVEGLDDARMCAEYAGEGVGVIGLAGRESWRKGGIPVPELRIVAGTGVVILFGPNLAVDLDTWNSAKALGEGCEVWATAAAFTRPPGVVGATVSAYLRSMEEPERSPALAHMLSSVTKNPGKKPAGQKLGAADVFDLPPTDDTTLGTEWADGHLDEFRVISTDKAWISYRDGRWSVEGAELEVGHSLMEFVTEASGPIQAAMLRAKGADPEKYEHLQRAKDAILSARKRQALANTAMVYRPVHVRRDELDQHPNLWCAKNRVIDLATGTVYDHTPAMLLTTGSDVPYLPGHESPRFDQFLVEVLPDADVREFVLQVFAMAMLGAVRDHVLPVMIGEGRNGKGTLIRIMLAVFGSHARVINPKALLKRKFDAHAEEIAQLAGKRLAVAEETGQGAVWDVARVNEWTGGNRLSGRFMHGNSFDFDPSHTLVMATNHRPSVGQGEQAFWDRYKEVPFEVSFYGREDYTLEPHIITHELPGVLNRLLEASARYHGAGKLIAPQAVDIATTEAKVDADNLARFCAEHIAVTHDHSAPGDRITNFEVYEMVSKWWSQNVRGEVLPSTRVFPKVMRTALGFPATMDNPRKLGQGSDSKRTWTGIRWLDGGGPRPALAPLPQNAPGSAVIGSIPMSNPSTPIQPVEDRTDVLPMSMINTAANTADVVDHETVVSADPELITDDTADTASKVVMVRLSEGDEGNVDQQGVNDVCFPPMADANRAHRQCGSISDLEAPLSGVLTFDLETDDADLQHDHPEPEKFVRLAGYSTGNGTITDASARGLIDNLLSSRYVMGSNLVHFDLPVLARIDSRVDVLELTAQGRVLDTMITESVLNPILNDKRPNAVGRAMVHFKLENACKRYGIPGKTNDAKKMAKEHGGFDKIPLEELDPYLRGDVEASKGLSMVMMQMLNSAPAALQSYVMREHQVHALASTMGAIGIQVDQELLQRRFWAGFGKKQRLTRKLIDKYDIPTVKADGKPADSPAATKDGKAALLRAFASLNVPESVMARTAKGAISFGGDAMRELAEQMAEIEHPNIEEIALLCDTVADIAGVRTVYGTALDALCSDGRVHPQVATFQSSGRWSTTKPGLTVFGKRKGKVIERAVFTATGPNAWEAETVLFAIDLSQIDARSVAVLSQDHAYMDIFGIDPETGKPRDSHAEVALAVWGDKAMRERAKPISHGWNYNMGKAKLAATAGSRQVAEEFHAAMERNFPRLVQWKAEMVQAASTGAFMDNGFGRMMLPDPERAHNQGPALMGQGCARDLMMECFLRLRPALRRMLRIQVHDEAIFEIPKENAEEIRREIEAAFNFEWAPPSMPWARPIQILAEAGHFAYRWSECY